mmetsp:Transcript_70555/g.147767  ORF Transcript_70555/g.147767 Transcript_70555/m.147767 type:complete len:286 (+) Transcript_70555:548-1405(+)
MPFPPSSLELPDGGDLASGWDDFQNTVGLHGHPIDVAVCPKKTSIPFLLTWEWATDEGNLLGRRVDFNDRLCIRWDTIDTTVRTFDTTMPLEATFERPSYRGHLAVTGDLQHCVTPAGNAVDCIVVSQDSSEPLELSLVRTTDQADLLRVSAGNDLQNLLRVAWHAEDLAFAVCTTSQPLVLTDQVSVFETTILLPFTHLGLGWTEQQLGVGWFGLLWPRDTGATAAVAALPCYSKELFPSRPAAIAGPGSLHHVLRSLHGKLLAVAAAVFRLCFSALHWEPHHD